MTPHTWPRVPRTDVVAEILADLDRPTVRGVLLTGAVGSGRSTLAEDVADAIGLDRLRLRGSETSRAIPFGALLGLLATGPDDLRLDDAAAVTHALLSLVRRHAEPGVTVVVDNADRIDEASAEVLAHALTVAGVRLVLVSGSLASLPTPLRLLFNDGLLAVRELEPWTSEEVERALRAALGGPVSFSALDTLVTMSGGNPLHLRYVVAEQLDAGNLVRRDDFWMIDRALVATTRFSDPLRARLDRWSDAERDALELVALAESVPLDVLEQLVDPAVLTSLLSDGTLEVVVDGPPSVAIRQALVIETLRMPLTFLRRRELHRRIGEVWTPSPDTAPAAVLAWAVWTLGCGAELPADLAVRAAQAAMDLFKPDLVNELTSQALVGPHRVLARALRSRAARLQARVDVAAEEMAQITTDDVAGSPPRAAAAATVEVLALTRFDPGGDERSRSFLGAVADADRTDPVARSMLAIARWDTSVARGRHHDVLDEVRQVVARGAGEALDLRVAAHGVLAESLLQQGRQLDALDVAMRIAEDAGSRALSGDARDLGYATLNGVLAKSGLLDVSVALMHERREERMRQLVYYGSAADAAAGSVFLLGGRAREADCHLRSALAQARVRDVRSGLGHALAGVAYVDALLGRQSAARDRLLEYGEGQRSYVHTEFSATYAALNARAVLGDDTAPAGLLGAADEAAALGLLMDELLLVASAARHGSAAALERLGDHRMEQPGALAANYYDWAAARTARGGERADRLLDVAEAALALGNPLLAAESAAAVQREPGSDPGRRASRLLREAEVRLLGPGSASTGEHDLAAPLSSALSVLTKRERDVATLVGRRLTNREVADQLVLSVRTVESYLRSAFEKLGITGRRELVDLVSAGG